MDDTMLLSSLDREDRRHELDFRFEVSPGKDHFLFAYHGACLHELLETCGLPALGSTFYLADMADPLILADAIRDPSLLRERYGVEPAGLHGRCFRCSASVESGRNRCSG